jgi:dethiobiotin synthetase
MSKPIFITGIGTDVGKTVVAAIVVEKLQADYWKPIQSGDLDNTDTMKVQRLVSNEISVFHPEAYRLTQPYSPHKAAALDGVEVEMKKIKLPKANNQLVVEGAGGLMVPLNNEHLMIDLIEKLNADVILVSRNYLGSINHTLLSLEALLNRGINIRAIIFNGDADEYTQSIIEIQTRHEVPVLHIGNLPDVSRSAIASEAVKLALDW